MSIIEKAASRIDLQRDAAPAIPVVRTEPVLADSATALAEPVLIDTAAAAVPPLPPVPPARPLPSAEAPVAAPVPLATAAPRQVELDLERMRASGLVTAAGGRTQLLEDFRIIKRPLLQRAFAARIPGERPANLVMITSSLPGEGKTWTAINLAMSIAMELDHTVLLVEADVARPSVLRTLGVPAQRGLMDVLVDHKLDVADVMLRTNVDTLSILPAGTATPRATELLASSAMSSLLAEIATRYPDRVVIFDSPPLLLTSEARVLASHMGQIAVVVEAEQTTQHAVLEALAQLEGCSNVNLIYNKSRDYPAIDQAYGYHQT
jgi:exopolysaccharide/PEP-CTERM locus tyrosine autokinase